MALQGWGTAPNCLSRSSALVSAAPMSFSAWCNTSVTNTAQTVVDESGSGTSNRFELAVDATGHVVATADNGSVNSSAVTSSTITASRWFHAGAVFTSTTSRAAYLNGGSKGTDATSVNPTCLKTTIGLWNKTTPAQNWGAGGTGMLCRIAIWNVALGDDDMFLLAAGVDPRFIRPWGLLAYIPITGTVPSSSNPEFDTSGHFNNFTLTGSLSFASDDAPLARDYFLGEDIFDNAGKGAAVTAKMRWNSSLNGLGASGPFFHDRLAA